MRYYSPANSEESILSIAPALPETFDSWAVLAYNTCRLAEVAEWHTRWSQKPLGETSYGFDSHLRHQIGIVMRHESTLMPPFHLGAWASGLCRAPLRT